jgi:hypothetical protein
MDFIFQLPSTKFVHDAILVFVDRLIKMVHFAPTTGFVREWFTQTNGTPRKCPDITGRPREKGVVHEKLAGRSPNGISSQPEAILDFLTTL